MTPVPPERVSDDDAASGSAGPGAVTWWRSPELAGVWSVLIDRLQRRGLRAEGHVVLRGLGRAERHALADLLGRDVPPDRVTVDLAALDERLRARAGRSLVEACAEVGGRPLVDRRAAAAARRERAKAPDAALEQWLAAHPDVHWPWVDVWMARLRTSGLIGRDDDAPATIRSALDVLWSRRHELSGSTGAGTVARADLAATLCHDAHALDDDRRLAGYVLRAAAVAHDLPFPDDAHSRREVWAAIGVLPDSVSATCLVWHLPARSWDADGRPWPLDTSAPFHLTWWHVRAGLRVDGATRVLVCENPRVLEAVAEKGVPGLAVVCTSGRPNLTTQRVLALVGSSSARLLYHGDFDWAGVEMANEAARRWGARPFRMTAADYEAAPASLPLVGRRVEPGWDTELGSAMRRRGVAVHEEAVLEDLLAHLS